MKIPLGQIFLPLSTAAHITDLFMRKAVQETVRFKNRHGYAFLATVACFVSAGAGIYWRSRIISFISQIQFKNLGSRLGGYLPSSWLSTAAKTAHAAPSIVEPPPNPSPARPLPSEVVPINLSSIPNPESAAPRRQPSPPVVVPSALEVAPSSNAPSVPPQPSPASVPNPEIAALQLQSSPPVAIPSTLEVTPSSATLSSPLGSDRTIQNSGSSTSSTEKEIPVDALDMENPTSDVKDPINPPAIQSEISLPFEPSQERPSSSSSLSSSEEKDPYFSPPSENNSDTSEKELSPHSSSDQSPLPASRNTQPLSPIPLLDAAKKTDALRAMISPNESPPFTTQENSYSSSSPIPGKPSVELSEESDKLESPAGSSPETPRTSIDPPSQKTTSPAQAPSPTIEEEDRPPSIVPEKTIDLPQHKGKAPADEPLSGSSLMNSFLAVSCSMEPPNRGQGEAAKALKYRHCVDSLPQSYGEEAFWKAVNEITDLSSSNVLIEECKQLIRLLTFGRTDDTRDQYHQFVTTLRRAADALTKEGPAVCRQFVEQLAYARFAGIHLFNYCSELVQIATEGEFPQHLSLENFWDLFENCNMKINHPKGDLAASRIAVLVQKLCGYLNFMFDPLNHTNIPYVDGELQLDGKKILLLRHGTPVRHGITRWAEITSDYIAFIRGAAERKQNILHIILENSEKSILGDESARAQARFELQTEPNFFPLKLRMDGAFFKHRNGHCGPEAIASLKKRFKDQLLGSSEKTGFAVPEKISEKIDPREIDTVLQQVEHLYFSKIETIENVDQHQAFLILSYAHLVLFLCKKLNISILEALCKDDQDRGNMFKTILKLHFLYVTHQITEENLKNILINTLAPPLIVKKQGVIDTRKVYLKHVLPLLVQAYQQCPKPEKNIGTENIQEGSYDVFKIEGQGISSPPPATPAEESYQKFLTSNPPMKEESSVNLIDEIAAGFTREGAIDKPRIKDQILIDWPRADMYLENNLLKHPKHFNEMEKEGFYKEALDRVQQFLVNNGIEGEEAWKVLCSCQQGLGADLMKPMFDFLIQHPDLNLNFMQDSDEQRTALKFELVAKNGVATIKSTIPFKVADKTTFDTIALMKGIITIEDHRTGAARVEYFLLPPEIPAAISQSGAEHAPAAPL